MILKLAAGVAILVGVVRVFAATRPDKLCDRVDKAFAASEQRVHSLHAADRSSHVAMRFRSLVAFGNSGRPRRAPAVGAHLLPCPRRSRLCHGLCSQRIRRFRPHTPPASLPIRRGPPGHHDSYRLYRVLT